eukprot:14026180-Alexandrium_andersonii.AAC.1
MGGLSHTPVPALGFTDGLCPPPAPRSPRGHSGPSCVVVRCGVSTSSTASIRRHAHEALSVRTLARVRRWLT